MSTEARAKDMAVQTIRLVFARTARFDVHCYAQAKALGFTLDMDVHQAAQWFEIPTADLQQKIADAAEHLGTLAFLGRPPPGNGACQP